MADILFEGGELYCTLVTSVNIFVNCAVLGFPLVGYLVEHNVCLVWMHGYGHTMDSCFWRTVIDTHQFVIRCAEILKCAQNIKSIEFFYL